MDPIDDCSLELYLSTVRTNLRNGDCARQSDLDALVTRLEESDERFGDTDEALELVDSRGLPNGLVAPRWLCHLLALRHACSHVMLFYQSPSMGRVFILQVRSWTKLDSPGHVEVSVGGHVQAGQSVLEAACAEMEQELGIPASDLVAGELSPVAGYESFNERPDLHFHNSEWREVYVGELTLEQLARLQLQQTEVAGLLLCPEREIGGLLQQQRIPLTSSLERSMPLCMEGTHEHQ